MARPCSVCQDLRRREIDRALIAGQSVAAVSAAFRASPDAVYRHRRAHLPVHLVEQQAAQEAREGLDVVRQLVALNREAREILAEARQTGEGDVALRAIDRLLKTLELQLRVTEAVTLEQRLRQLEDAIAAAGHSHTARGGASPWRAN